MLDREIIQPRDESHWLELRKKDITSTQSSALFGLSPYTTYYELFHSLKSGKDLPFKENEFMKWGQRLQDAIAAGVAEDQGWVIRKMTEYIRIPSLRMGSSFDFEIVQNASDPDHLEYEKGILEIKNVFGLQFKEQWLEDDDGNLEAPPHIEMQVQHQLAVSGYSFAYIAALVSGNQVQLIKRERDEKVINAIKQRVAAIYAQVESGVDPEPNFELDASFICSLYGYAEPGKVLDVGQNERVLELVTADQKLKSVADGAKSGREAIKAELITIIGDAEKAVAPGFSISASTVGPTLVAAFERKGHRRCVISMKKEKK